MKRKTKIVLFSFLTINFILQIIYQFVIRPNIPYDWWYMSDTNYPLDIADHFTDCFFGLNYFLVGYLFFAEKYYCDSMSEGKRTNRWNILYILVILLVFCWSFEAVRFFPLMSKIPWFRSFLIEYYQKNPPSLPPGCVS